MPLPTHKRCRIVAGPLETTYHSLGCGPTVVVLDGALSVEPEPTLLCHRLSRYLRILAPRIPPGAHVVGIASWLGDFLDGVGATRVALLSMSSHAGVALQLACTRPWQVSRIAVMVAAPSWQPSAPAVRDHLAEADLPLLIVPGHHRVARLAHRLAPFLAGKDTSPGPP